MTFPLPSAFDVRFPLAPASGFDGAVSLTSSYWVAEVEYESWAEELRLCGGEATLVRPSEFLAEVWRDIDLPSPVPLRKLGAALDG